LTPEEWVRQHFIHYLNTEKNYPIRLMGVEQVVKYNSMQTRADIVLYTTDGKEMTKEETDITKKIW